MLNNSGESGHLCLVPDLRGNAFSFSPLRMFAVGLSYMAFIILPFYAHFWSFFFYHKWVLNFVKSFFCIYRDYHMVFIFQFVNHIDWFAYTEESLHPWDKPDLLMVYDLCNVLLNCLLEFWWFLHLCSSVILVCDFLFCVVFVWFCYRGDSGLKEWVWKCSFLCNFMEEF